MYPIQLLEISIGIITILSTGYIFQRSFVLFADLRSKKNQIIALAFGVASGFAIVTVAFPCFCSIVGLVNPFKRIFLEISLLTLCWIIFFWAKTQVMTQLKTSHAPPQ